MEKYFDDNYKFDFEAKIIDKRDDFLILSNTYFYPRGGNQDFDTGEINIDGLNFNVIKVTKNKDSGEIYHHISNNNDLKSININADAVCTINWPRRYRLMKNHTTQHLLSSLILQDFGIDTYQVEIGEYSVHIKLEEDLSLENILSIEEKANNLLCNNINVDRQFDGNRFKIKIGNIDIRECGGTHVKLLSEIGSVFITNHYNNGFDFVTHDESKIKRLQFHSEILKIRNYFNQKSADEVINEFSLLSNDNNNLKCELKKINTINLKIQLESRIKINKHDFSFVTSPDTNVGEMKEVIRNIDYSVIALCKNGSILIKINNNNQVKASFIMNSIKDISPNMKGGGSDHFAQGGPWTGTIDEIKSIVQQALNYS